MKKEKQKSRLFACLLKAIQINPSTELHHKPLTQKEPKPP